MRRPAQVGMVALIAILIGATGLLFVKYRTATSDFHKLQTSEQESRNRYGQAINEIAVIQDSLNAIVLGDEAAQLKSMQLDSEQKLGSASSDDALERIALIKAGIERTKDRIEALDAELKKSGVKVAGLQKMVNNLKKSVAEKETQVAELTARVENLETQVTGLTAEVQENENTIQEQGTVIEEKRSELATIYYVIGTKRDLTSAGLVVASGGFLGMGKTLEPSGKVDPAQFTRIDTDYETMIRIPAKKAEILTAQPSQSYELQASGDEVILRIVDPEEFRKVKHLLIMTTV